MVDAKDIKFQQFDGRTLLDINDGGFVGIANGATSSGEIRFFEDTDNGSNYVGLNAGSISSSFTLTLPTADGSSGQFLKTDGSGALSFDTVSSAADDLTAGDAAVSLTTTAGNITIDAQGNDTDIIFKGTDGSSDTTFLTIDGSDAGTLIANHDLELGTDGSIIKFGADNEITLTHVADTGLLLEDSGGSPTLQLHDSAESVSSDGSKLILTSNSVAFSLPTADGSSGQFLKTNGSGTLSFDTVSSAADDLTAGDAAVNLTTTSGNITIDAQAGDSDIIFKGTDGSSDTTFLTIDGSDAGTLIANHNLELGTDDSEILFGADNEVKLIHNADKGLILKHTATADDKPVVLTLQTGETDIAANDVIGRIHFQAPDEGTGTDAILVAAGIQAVSEGDFSSSSNATRLEFLTAASEAASSKMTLTSGGILNVTELHGGSTNDAGGTVSISNGDSGASANASASELVVENNGAAGISILSFNNNDGNIFFGDGQDDDVGRITYNHTNNRMDFYTNASERMRITSSGEIGINEGQIDTAGIILKVSGAQNNTVCRLIHKNTGSTTETLMDFRDGDIQQCGTINIAPASNTVSFNTSSDYRLKENESAISDGITRVKQLKPYRFNWIKDTTDTKVDGFFAHEVSSIVPEAIDGEKDEMEKYRENQERPEGKNVGDFVLDKDGNQIPKYQQIDQSKLVPVLTAALKESITKIEALEARVTTLEG